MAYTIQLPDQPAEAKGRYTVVMPKAEEPPDPTGSFLENAAAGAGKAVMDLYHGGKQLLGIGDQKALQEQIDEEKRLSNPLMKTGGGVTGNIAGNIAMTALPMGAVVRGASMIPKVAAGIEAAQAAAPILSGIGAGATAGGVAGALEPVATGESRGKNIALNAGVGGVGGALPGVLSRVISPKTGADARALIDEGVTLTPGQTLGGVAKKVEDSLTSVPLLGDMIKRAQNRTLDDFNRAGFNRVLAPLGEKVGPGFQVGRQGVAEVESKVGMAYDKVLDKIGRVDIDNKFSDEVGKVIGMSAELGEGPAKQLEAIIKNRVLDKMTDAGTMSADTMKLVESELGRQARRFSSSQDATQRGLGDAIREVQAALRRNVERAAGPELADDLKAANTAWANFVRIQDAAGRIGAKEGVFTPAQLTSAVRKNDGSVRKGAFARGDALMQDLAESGKNVLPSQVADSGTAGRLMTAGGLGGIATHLGFLDPSTLAAGGAAMLPYTATGQKALMALLAKRPEFAKELSQLLEAGAMPAALTAGATAPLLTRP